MQTVLFNVATVAVLAVLVLGPKIADLYLGTGNMEQH
jgi:hypothetical protein